MSTVLAAPARKRSDLVGLVGALCLLAIGVAYAGYNLVEDIATTAQPTSWLPFLLLGVALTIALGFEFVNGFHDTANAVATVIYTHSLPPTVAVVWSGCWNLIGVLTSTGAVAFGIISLLPVELILQVGSSAGFAMVFALLVAAICWNLGTWYFGLPNSSSHTLIGSIIGVGLMNQLMSTGSGTSGVDWSQALGVGRSLLFSPLVGFVLSALLLLLSKLMIRIPKLYKEPEGKAPPPWWIRGLLVLTCTGVSFAHGSNDGQKGMGLIMLILIGTVPTAYALNKAVDNKHVESFFTTTQQAIDALGHYGKGAAPADPAAAVTAYVSSRTLGDSTIPALQALAGSIASQVKSYGSLANVPAAAVGNVRNDMYLASEAIRLMQKQNQPAFNDADKAVLKTYAGDLNNSTKFIPTWVKVAVALALGLGTMVGWKRIVVTVGEKIGKEHLTYAQGASAEIVAMVTIGAADAYGLPVSTTHVLSSGVAGTMAANRSGLQWGTIRSLIMAWVLTLPMSIVIAGVLYWIFRLLFAV
jgi:PiT family inorganic phosphate transporter